MGRAPSIDHRQVVDAVTIAGLPGTLVAQRLGVSPRQVYRILGRHNASRAPICASYFDTDREHQLWLAFYRASQSYAAVARLFCRSRAAVQAQLKCDIMSHFQ